MAPNEEEILSESFDQHARVVRNDTPRAKHMHTGDVSLQPSRWWFLSTAFPMIAGTLGPVASAFSICSLAEPWRQQLVPGGDIQDAPSVPDPPWLSIVEAIQLLAGIISNLFLLLNMARRVRFNLALPITIIGWYASSLCRTVLTATASRPLKAIAFSKDELIWSQSFYYGIWAAILYFVDASLLTITFWGACTGHYRKDLLLTSSQRTLIALLIPLALAGIISLGLVISSVRNLVLEHGRRCVGARVDDRIRGKIIRKLLHSSDSKSLEPIHEELKTPPTRSNEARETEFERRRAEFALMRKIQAKSSIRRRWVAMAFSTFTWLVLWLVGAFVFQRAEKAYQDWSYFDALYFCFEAWTTIGYGDLTPISNAGRSFYVFWSLLALPTMTVLISNASDTVVRIIRDGTILVGNFTILPNDRGFAGNLKSFISKITFGKVFPGNLDSGSPKPVASSKDIDQRSAGTTAEFHGLSLRNDDRGLLDVSFGGQTVSQITGPQNTRAQSLFTSDVRHNGLHELATSTDFQLLLISELQVVIGHLKEPKPHHYTFDQWVWYLKLIGEDEHSPQTHCKVNLEKTRHYPNEDDSDRVFKWSWVGNGSPLLGAEEESKWILGRLMDKLEESLLVQRRWRFGNGSRISLPEARHVQDLDRDGLVDKR
ncbi:hypothetical protein QL093DRAFT_2590998 [Fusarium oxysporum]|nr:hypothetical protein QL093DRAFT_2590998 [Fusarium oxysporum]